MHGEGQALALREAVRFFHRSAGPVPRDPSTYAKTERPSVVRDRLRVGGKTAQEQALLHYRDDECSRTPGMARDRPSPYGDRETASPRSPNLANLENLENPAHILQIPRQTTGNGQRDTAASIISDCFKTDFVVSLLGKKNRDWEVAAICKGVPE